METFDRAAALRKISIDGLAIDETGQPHAPAPGGKDSAEGGAVAWASLHRAIELAQSGEVQGIVTAPLSKKSLHLAGHPENGHTEILARCCGVDTYALMLYSPKIRCGFVTCHTAFQEITLGLTIQRVVEVTELMHHALFRIDGSPPRLCLPALNPHAGEGGIFGSEEEEVLEPAISEAKSRGIKIEGPVPSDTAFTPGALEKYDGYVCLYHDQGGIPFKMLSFDAGVNVTLGLPIIRTSVCHGTAYDIAWSGRASNASMLEAAELALLLAER